jgi:hypothetical protein
MQVETKFLSLCHPATLGEVIDRWRVCWLGGWGKNQLFFYVMVERNQESTTGAKGRTT